MTQDKFSNTREAAKITLKKVSSWEDQNATDEEDGDVFFKEKTRAFWKEFAVSGKFIRNPETGERELRNITDFDGRTALGILQLVGIDTSDTTYIKPGQHKEGAINLDTGDKYGVVFYGDVFSDTKDGTAFFDHHEKGGPLTSTAEIVYNTLVGLGFLERDESMDRLVDFVNKIDNRQYAAEEFLRIHKTLLGLQREFSTEQLLAYFSEHESPLEELTIDELAKYGENIREAAESRKKFVDHEMKKVALMEKEGKIVDTMYGKILINTNNELRAGASAAYVSHDGILNITPGKSFAFMLKTNQFNEELLRNVLGENFQGKIIRKKMWIYNDSDTLKLSVDDIIRAAGGKM